MKTCNILIIFCALLFIMGSSRYHQDSSISYFDLAIVADPNIDNTLILNWYPVQSKGLKFEIHYNQVGSAFVKKIEVGAATEHKISNLMPNVDYEFDVIGYDLNQKIVAASGKELYSPKAYQDLQYHAESFLQPMFDLKMLSLYPENFPHILSYVSLDTAGLNGAVIKEENFRAYENGVNQLDNFNVTLPDSFGAVRLVDFVFLIDNTGSMKEEINDVLNNVNHFVDTLQARGIDFRLGLVIFGQQKYDGLPILIENGNMTGDVEEFKKWLTQMTDVGKWEYGILAVREAAKGMHFRPQSSRHFLLITDDDSDGSNIPQLIQETITICRANNIIVHCAVNCEWANSYWHYCDPENSIRATGGLLFPVIGPYEDILNELQHVISNTYIVQYRASNPNCDASLREVIINCSYLSYSSQDTGYYVCGGAPKIERTPETKALSKQSLIENNDIPIAAYVTDKVAPIAHTASLFYRHIGASSYEKVLMAYIQDSTWAADIPAAVVLEPGVEYYLSAADSYITTTDPPIDADKYPYHIAVQPNYPPCIEHTPIKEYSILSRPITVHCIATDTTYYLNSVRLHYKKTGTLSFSTDNMKSGINPDLYTAEIPAAFVTDAGIDYYISATDNFGITSTHGTMAEPHHIEAVLADSIVIEAEEMQNRISYFGSACEDGWRLTHENHPIYEDVPFGSPGNYLFTVVAKAEIGNKLAPWLQVQVGEEFKGTCEINSTDWAKYSFVTAISGSTCRLSLNYLNDYWVRHVDDRNLLLDKVIIRYYGSQNPMSIAYTFEAENMGHQHPQNYQQGDYMVLHRPFSYVGHDLYLEKQDLTCTIIAKADSVAGSYPLLDVMFDDEIVRSFEIDRTGNASYQINLVGTTQLTNIEPGLHCIKFVYDQDSWAYDRNIYIDKLIIYSNGGFLKPAPNYAQGQNMNQGLPTQYALEQNYPNPFNPVTFIRFQLPEYVHVEINIFNTIGQKIRTLINEDRAAGYHTVYWDGKDASGNQAGSGIYLYQIKAGNFRSMKKMALLK